MGNSIPTLLEEFARIQSTDIVLPVRDGRTYGCVASYAPIAPNPSYRITWA